MIKKSLLWEGEKISWSGNEDVKQKILASYAPSLYLGDKDFEEGVADEKLGNEIRKGVLKELNNIKNYEKQFSQTKWIFNGHEPIDNNQVTVYLTDSWENKHFALNFKIYKATRAQVIAKISQELNAKRRQEKNGDQWLQKTFVEGKSNNYLHLFHKNINMEIIVNNEKILISYKRIVFKTWDKPRDTNNDSETTLWLDYLNESSRIRITISLKGKKYEEEQELEKEKNTDDIKNASIAAVAIGAAIAAFAFYDEIGAGISALASWFAEKIGGKVAESVGENINNEFIENVFEEVEPSAPEWEPEPSAPELEDIPSAPEWDDVANQIDNLDVGFEEIPEFEPVQPSAPPEEMLPSGIDELPQLPEVPTNPIVNTTNEIAKNISKKIAERVAVLASPQFFKSSINPYEETKKLFNKVLENINLQNEKEQWFLQSLDKNSKKILKQKIQKKVNYKIVKELKLINISPTKELIINEILVKNYLESEFDGWFQKQIIKKYDSLIDVWTHAICEKLLNEIENINRNSKDYLKWLKHFRDKIKEKKYLKVHKKLNAKVSPEVEAKIKFVIDCKLKVKADQWFKNFVFSETLKEKIAEKLKNKWQKSFGKNCEQNQQKMMKKIVENDFLKSFGETLLGYANYHFYKIIDSKLDVPIDEIINSVIKKRLNQAITNREQNLYQIIKKEPYGIFDKTYYGYYYLLKLEQIIILEHENSDFALEKFQNLKTDFEGKLDGIMISKNWYHKNNELTIDLIQKFIFNIMDKKIIIQDKQICLNTSKIKVIKVVGKNLQKLEIKLEYSEYKTQFINIEMLLV